MSFCVVARTLGLFAVVVLSACGGDEIGGDDSDPRITWTQQGATGHLEIDVATSDVVDVRVDVIDSSVPGDETIGARVWSESSAGCCAEEHQNGRLARLSMRIPLWNEFRNSIIVTMSFAVDVEREPFVRRLDLDLTDAALADVGAARLIESAAGGGDNGSGVHAVDGMWVEIPSPATTTSCIDGSVDWCQDGDDDGLVDNFEMLLLHLARPHLVVDPEDKIFSAAPVVLDENGEPATVGGIVADDVAFFSSTIPMIDDGSLGGYQDAGRHFVYQTFAIAYEYDYGANVLGVEGVDNHPGDTELAALLWVLEDDAAGQSRLSLHSVSARGHRGFFERDDEGDVIGLDRPVVTTTTDPRDVFVGDDGRLLLFVEPDKHGTWTRPDDCVQVSPYDCVELGDEFELLRPRAVNIGSPPPGSPWASRVAEDFSGELFRPGRPFIDSLDDVPGSLHAPTFDVFPGEAVWSDAARQKEPAKFCGGHPPDGCASQIGDIATRAWPGRVYLGDQLVRLGEVVPVSQPEDDPGLPRVIVLGQD